MKYYTRQEISDMSTLSIGAIVCRAEILEIFHDYIFKKKYYYSQGKTDAIIAYVKLKQKENFLILESKMNYEN